MKMFGKQDTSDAIPTGVVTISKSKPYCTIRINNAAHSNVLNRDVISQLTGAFEDVSADDNTRCIILAAEGVHFSAGPSLDEMCIMSKTDAVRWYRAGTTLCNLIENTRQPVICAIQGNCLSYGLSIALACDIRIAAANARLAFPDIRHIQLVPGWGATQRLVHMIGSQDAKYLLITGEFINADDALNKFGIVHDVVSNDRLYPEATRIADIICTADLEPLSQLKHAINSGVDVEFGTAIKIEEHSWISSWDVEDRAGIIQDAIHNLNTS